MSCKRRRRIIDADQEGRAIKKSKKQVRNWLDMPEDIMLLIFVKLGVVEILVNAQNVCTFWRKLAKKPSLYRALDLQAADNCMSKPIQLIRLAQEAVDRIREQLVKLSSIEGYSWEDILLYVNHTNSPKSLRLREGTKMTGNDLVEAVRGLDSVEELDIWHPSFVKTAIEQLGRTSRKLTSFRLHIKKRGLGKCSDEEVSIIVRNLTQLRRLSLVEFVLTNKGLQTILDGFPLLEHLDLQRCLCDKVCKDLLKRCASIKTVIPSLGMSQHYFLR